MNRSEQKKCKKMKSKLNIFKVKLNKKTNITIKLQLDNNYIKNVDF